MVHDMRSMHIAQLQSYGLQPVGGTARDPNHDRDSSRGMVPSTVIATLKVVADVSAVAVEVSIAARLKALPHGSRPTAYIVMTIG